jgi:hypothetical protein
MAKAYAYEHESFGGYDDYYGDSSYSGSAGCGSVGVGFILLMGFIFYWLFKGKSVEFDARDHEAFQKIVKMKADLKTVTDIVAPAPPAPSYSATVAVNVPKPPEPSSK